jgi:hypothetical protein
MAATGEKPMAIDTRVDRHLGGRRIERRAYSRKAAPERPRWVTVPTASGAALDDDFTSPFDANSSCIFPRPPPLPRSVEGGAGARTEPEAQRLTWCRPAMAWQREEAGRPVTSRRGRCGSPTGCIPIPPFASGRRPVTGRATPAPRRARTARRSGAHDRSDLRAVGSPGVFHDPQLLRAYEYRCGLAVMDETLHAAGTGHFSLLDDQFAAARAAAHGDRGG